MSAFRLLLGLDPGLRSTGWGVIRASGSHLSHVDNGTITTSNRLPVARRLVELEEKLGHVVHAFDLDSAAVETAFVAKDVVAALKLGQARAIALLVPARAGLPVAEYAPNQIKKTVSGAGHADKQQMQTMVRLLLPKAVLDSEHAADALATAVCHAHMGFGAGQGGSAAFHKTTRTAGKAGA